MPTTIRPNLSRLGDAYAPEAFEAANDLTWHVPWYRWRRRGSVSTTLPERPKALRGVSNRRALNPFPRKGETRAQAERRVALARSYFGRKGNRIRRIASATLIEWRMEIGFELTATTDSRLGPQVVRTMWQASPWFTAPRGHAVSQDRLRAAYLDLCRAAVRGTTGYGVGTEGQTTDARHGPRWAGPMDLDPDEAPDVNPVLATMAAQGVTYDNSFLRILPAPPEARHSGGAPKGRRQYMFARVRVRH